VLPLIAAGNGHQRQTPPNAKGSRADAA
jgi:hypothetical protein